MAIERVESAGALKPLDLREIISARPPCVTISAPAEGPQQLRVRLKNAVKSLAGKLQHRSGDNKDERTLLEPLQDIGQVLESGKDGHGLVVFRSANVFTSIWTREPVREEVVVADHFQIRTLLPQLTGERKFYILALSQKHVRLLRCADHGCEEADLPHSAPRNYDEWMNTAKPDHDLDNRSIAGPSSGTSSGILFGTSVGKEKKDQYLLHFYRAVDNGVHEALRNDPAPLVLAGVEYELSLYHAVTQDEHVVPGGVHGAADGLKGGELHARALELANEYFKAPVRKALATFDEAGAERRSITVKEIVPAAWDGRIAQLFLHETAEYRGVFRVETHQIKKHDTNGDEEDLLNAAAVQTLAHGGNVFVLPGEEMPNGVAAAALFRW